MQGHITDSTYRLMLNAQINSRTFCKTFPHAQGSGYLSKKWLMLDKPGLRT